jgi:TetR/AcrR family transcriptional regulator, transcriptional repressor for nem operon
VRVTKEKAAENRTALLRAAGRLFRERGIDGVGVAEISKAAGLTHGALYAQFPSKDALVAEALAEGLRSSRKRLLEAGGEESRLTDMLDFLLSPSHRDDLAMGCPMTASASEAARQDEAVRARFADGFEGLVSTLEAALTEVPPAERRERALTIAAAQIGAVAVARAVAKAQPRLSDELLDASRRVLGAVGGERARGRRPARNRRA